MIRNTVIVVLVSWTENPFSVLSSVPRKDSRHSTTGNGCGLSRPYGTQSPLSRHSPSDESLGYFHVVPPGRNHLTKHVRIFNTAYNRLGFRVAVLWLYGCWTAAVNDPGAPGPRWAAATQNPRVP